MKEIETIRFSNNEMKINNFEKKIGTHAEVVRTPRKIIEFSPKNDGKENQRKEGNKNKNLLEQKEMMKKN